LTKSWKSIKQSQAKWAEDGTRTEPHWPSKFDAKWELYETLKRNIDVNCTEIFENSFQKHNPGTCVMNVMSIAKIQQIFIRNELQHGHPIAASGFWLLSRSKS
jgi:hypothetical protein